MKKIGIGIVGLGFIANGVHIPGIKKCPDLKLAAICDANLDALNAAQKLYGFDDAHCFTDYRDMINCPEVDAVDICTPNDLHYPVAKYAIEKGKPYNLEKPVGLNKLQADTLAEMTKEKGLANMVCFSYRFKAAARYARDLVQSGKLGEIYHVHMQYFQAWGMPYQNVPMRWYHKKEHSGSGVLGDLGSHGIDLVHFITGKNYSKVFGHQGTFIKERRENEGSVEAVDVDDFTHFLAELNSHISASFLFTRFAYGRGNYQRLEISGSNGALIYKLDETPGLDELEVCIGEPYASVNKFTKIPVPEKYYVNQMQSFADVCLKSGDGLSADIFDGLENQRVIDGVIESARTGNWYEL